MKKRKLLMSLGSVAALTVPMASVLMTTSCGSQKYAELVSEMKDDCIQTFMSICKNTHRNLWNEGEAFKYIKKTMQGFGYDEPVGYDDWSQLNAVKRMRLLEMSGNEDDYGEYGNLWYDIEATPGLEKAPKIILQCHMDSQMSFANDTVHKNWARSIDSGLGGFTPNFNNTDEIMTSDETSLGADGGVGMAILLTIAKYRNSFTHPGIRLLFTAGESEACPELTLQSGKLSEFASGFSLLYYDQKHIKPDGETLDFWHAKQGELPEKCLPFGEKGEFKYIASMSGVIKNTIFVSSSGIHECAVSTSDNLEEGPSEDLKWNQLNDKWGCTNNPKDPDNCDNLNGNKIYWDEVITPEWAGGQELTKNYIKISVSGLQGGTSSTYIGRGQANAVNLLYRVLFSGDVDLQLISAHSADEDGAYSLATSAEATVATIYDQNTWDLKIKSMLPSLKVLYPNEDWANVVIKAEPMTGEKPIYAMSKRQSRDFIRMIAAELYYGPINWFDNGDLKTSENVGPCNLKITERKDASNPAHYELNFHVVERSSEKEQLVIFKALTHSILYDGLNSWFDPINEPAQRRGWQTSHVQHMTDPVWKAPDTVNDNKLAVAFQHAYNQFKIRNKIGNEHAWLEIACASQIYEDLGWGDALPHCIMIGPQVEKNHSLNEVLYTDTLGAVLETTVYVLDNASNLLPN